MPTGHRLTGAGPGSHCGLLSCRSRRPPFASLGGWPAVALPPGQRKRRTEMKHPKQVVREVLGRPISGRVTAPAVALMSVLAAAAALSGPGTAVAASQPQLPFRCFAQVGVDHVVFGPDSFFLPNTVQGPTSFRENAGPTVVTYPLYHGTSQGRDVSYVITDASNLSVAQA